VRMRDIQILLTVAETASFTRTADVLRLSQPAISLAVKRFEEEFAVRIFERQGHNVSISEDGRRIVDALRKMEEIFQSSLRGKKLRSRLALGVSSLLSACDLASLIAPLQQSGAGETDLVFGASQLLAQRSDLDLCIDVPPIPAAEGDPLAVDVDWIGASNGVFLRSTEEPHMWDVALHVLRGAGVPIGRIVEVNSSANAYELAAGGLGLTPCITGKTGRFAGRRIAGLPRMPKLAVAIRSADRRLLELASALVKVGLADGARRPPVNGRRGVVVDQQLRPQQWRLSSQG
jgi:DNA-binding transcriptional LysR family regulator